MDKSQIKSAKYYKDSMTNENVSVTVTVDYDDKVTFSIPMGKDNMEYQEVLAWVAAGNTIEASDE